jgi:hypothetical protein
MHHDPCEAPIGVSKLHGTAVSALTPRNRDSTMKHIHDSNSFETVNKVTPKNHESEPLTNICARSMVGFHANQIE